MKRLKTGAVNSISFIRNLDYAINSFDVTFEKVVGPTVLSLSNLQDNLELATCSDFIVLNIDLVTHSLEGGEYYLTISNEGNSSTYLCEVQAHQYNTLSSESIYSDSVVLSNDVTGYSAPENTEGTEPNSGGSSAESMSVTLRDPNYGDMTSPYYLRTDNWSAQAHMTNIGASISKVKFRITDSSLQEITKELVVTDRAFTSLYFDIEDETINFGDVADWVIEGLNSSDEVVYTSNTYKLLIPPKMNLYLADSLSAANDMRLNGSSNIEMFNGDTTTYNLYAYVESNHLAQIKISNVASVRDKVFSNANPSALFGTSLFAVTPATGSMELISSDVVPSWSYETSERNIRYYSIFNWTGGYVTPLLNNIADLYNFNSYGISANVIDQRPYAKETLTISGTTFTLEGFSPILYNSLTSYTNSRLALYMGNGSYQMNTNYVNSLAVQQEYSDGTTEEVIITKAQLANAQVFPAMQGDTFDVYAYVSRINSSKTLVHNKVWIKYGSYWFNINNSSVDAPHFLLEV